MRRGLLKTVPLIAVLSGCIYVLLNAFTSEITASPLDDLAQIGATLFIAYALETASLVKIDGSRDAKHEEWLGVVTAFGACAFLGIGICLVLNDGSKSLNDLESAAFSVAVTSIGMLGILVAAFPYLWYEWIHQLRTRTSDE
jgi:cytochrome bd-type quinol oxidase subunit 2